MLTSGSFCLLQVFIFLQLSLFSNFAFSANISSNHSHRIFTGNTISPVDTALTINSWLQVKAYWFLFVLVYKNRIKPCSHRLTFVQTFSLSWKNCRFHISFVFFCYLESELIQRSKDQTQHNLIQFNRTCDG